MTEKNISTLCLIVVLTVLTCTTSMAAYFRVDSDSGAAVQAGDSFSLKIYLTPGEGEKLMGAKCTLNVDPEFIEIGSLREDFAADPSFKFVETFKTDPDQGMVSFRARTAEGLEDEKLFLVIPAKLKKEGATFVNFTSSALGSDNKWSPSAPGYFKMMGMSGENVDPLLAATLESDNSLLSTGSFFHSYKIKPQGDSAISTLQFDMGMTALEQASDEENADVIVKFSKEKARIGTGKYVRLDLIIDKYPETADVFTGIDVKIKYDPSMLQFTNSTGQSASQVEIVKRLEETPVDELQKLAKAYELDYTTVDFRGESKPAELQQEELIQLIRSYEGFRDETIFSFPFGADTVDTSNNHIGSSPEDSRTIAAALDANFVDNAKGEIHLTLLVDFSLKREDIKMPQKVVTLIFKGLKPTENTPVEISQALLGEATGKLLLKNAYVTVDPKQEACDKSLPATLCQGTFKVTGDVAFDISKKKTQRATFIRDTDNSLIPSITTVEKFALSETWNLHLNGSLENGLKINGRINKIPNQEQKLDIGVAGDNGTIRFGDFNTGFNGTTKVNSMSSQISGMELQYGFDDFTFSALMAEGRSETVTSTFTRVTGVKEYSLGAGPIITNTVQVVNNSTGKVVDPSEYTVDYVRNSINFKKDLDNTDSYNATHERSTFIFSSGNINTFGLAYDSQKDNPQKKERFKVDTAFMTSTAAKGGRNIFQDTTETINLVDYLTGPCPKKTLNNQVYEEKNTCRTIYLKNKNIQKDSIRINNTYIENDKGVYITHRSYSSGKIILDQTVFNGTITINYSFYNPVAIYDNRILVLNNGLPVTGSSVATELDILWPSDAMPGSEEIYISKNTDYNITSDDLYVDYKYPGIDPWKDELEDQTFKEISLLETSTVSAFTLTYYFDTQFLDVLPLKLIFGEDPGTEGAAYQYIKMRFKSAPPEIEGSSEFAKTALGVDMMYQPKSNLRFDAQYALTNSDLTSAYGSDEETIEVDVHTHDSVIDDDRYGKNCNYLVTDSGTSKNREMVCNLAHKNVKTPVNVYIQFCKPDGNDPRNKCEPNPDGTFNYEDTIYELSSAIHNKIITIDDDNGTIIFTRSVDTSNGGQVEGTFKQANIDHRFLTYGDRIYLRYLYSQDVGELVEGDSITLKTEYTGKKLGLTLTKDINDPYYDSSFKGKLTDGTDSTVDRTKLELKYKVNKLWSTTFDRTSSTKEKLEAGIVSSTFDSIDQNYSLRYSKPNAKHLTSFVFSRAQKDQTGAAGLSIKEQTANKSDDNKTAALAVTIIKNVLDFNTGYKIIKSDDVFNKGSSFITTTKNLTANYIPFSKLSMKLTFENSGSSGKAKTRTNKYDVTLKPHRMFLLNMNFDRTTKPDATSTDSTLSEDNAYTLTVQPFYNVTNFSIKLTQNKKPATNSIFYSTGTENREAKFDFKLAKDLILTPTLTQYQNRTESLLNRNTSNYQLSYKPRKNRFNLSIVMKSTISNSTTFSKYLTENKTISIDNRNTNSIDTSISPSKKSTLSVGISSINSSNAPSSDSNNYIIKYNIKPSANTTFSTDYTQKISSVSPSTVYKFNYSYNYTSKLSFTTSFRKSFTGTAAATEDTVNTSYDFNTSFKLNANSTLDMTYKQSITEGAKNSLFVDTPPNFTARLRSSFR